MNRSTGGIWYWLLRLRCAPDPAQLSDALFSLGKRTSAVVATLFAGTAATNRHIEFGEV